jgi:thiamine-phosphate diphosphorylase
MEPPLPALYPIVDPGGPSDGAAARVDALAEAILGAGAQILQLRMKGMPGGFPSGAVLAAARRLRRVTRDAGALLVVNDRVDIALLADADGVHVGQDDLPYLEARRLVGARRVIGVSTHTVEEAVAAAEAGADYIGFGPMYPTTSKSDTRPQRSLDLLREVRAAVTLPIVAIGGISLERVAEVRAAGADSVAVIAAIGGAADPAAATRALLRAAERPA